jgi:D-3-phosphoglycerate dehydrogenase / 2-oxoglutarate reductase
LSRFTVITPAGGSYEHEMEALSALGAEIVEFPATREGYMEAASQADALYVKGMRFDAAMIAALPQHCRGIVLSSVGVDAVDVAAATAQGIPVTNCPDTFIEEVADHAMTLLLGGFRRLVEQDRMVREGRWREGRPHLYQFPRLMGSTLGFIAFGHVARAVALRARPFGLRMLAYDPFVEELVMPPYGVEPATLDEVLSRSDFVSMHAPGTPEAQGMLTERHFQLMKPTAWLINTGRGATVDEPALITALQQGWIAGAALDVLAQEPPRQDNPLLQMPNVILTAHVASASARFDPARKRRVGQELALLLSGRWPMSCVNPTVLAASGLRRWQPVSMERGPNS